MNSTACISEADLSRLWDGDVMPQERTVLEQHLATCSQCRSEWEKVSRGAAYIAQAFRGGAKALAQSSCLSEELVAGYLSDALDPIQKRTVEDHLQRCSRCREETQRARECADAYEQDGDQWWSEYVGRQILAVIAAAPEEFEESTQARPKIVPFPAARRNVVQLPLFGPSQNEALAAATGDGFFEEVLRQEDPPFELHLVQFGRQVRVSARVVDANSIYADCVAQVNFLEGDTRVMTRAIHINQGQGQCTLEPQETASIRPARQSLTVRLLPLTTLRQVRDAGSEVYLPKLAKLLRHQNPRVRQLAVEVLTRISDSSAREKIAPLVSDPDEKVRAVTQRALGIMSGPRSQGTSHEAER